jgi:hypothetical protein
VTGISFRVDERGLIDYRAEERLKVLGLWLTGDIQSSLDACLDLLADLDDISAGRKPEEEWEGNAWYGVLRPDGVELRNQFRAVLQATYPLAEVRRAAESYWRVLAEDPEKETVIDRWEEWNKRPHPLRGAL